MSFIGKLTSIFGTKKLDESFFEDLEDVLIESDFGATNAVKIGDAVREAKPKTEAEFFDIVKKFLSEKIGEISLQPPKNELSVYVILGVNGVGKTTSIAKLGRYYTDNGIKTVFAAADTFRAAAINQLETHAQRLGIRIVKQENGSDPGAVIFDAISSAIAKNDNLVLCDTAGRMHNREDLVKELQKIDKIVEARVRSENYKKILVLDSTTGQNIISQAEVFNNAVGLDALILTKYDSHSRAGAIAQLDIPVAFIGNGEHYDDIYKFDKQNFIDSLLEPEPVDKK